MSPRMAFGSLLAAAGLALTTVSAFAQAPIGPNQKFAGAINGSEVDANVFVICPGPIGPGQTGHPRAGQGVQVIENSGSGFTGSAANRIVATLNPASSVAGLVFTQYGVAQNIPTTMLLPCGGTGTAVFTPLPGSTTARNSTVTMHFINIAV